MRVVGLTYDILSFHRIMTTLAPGVATQNAPRAQKQAF